MLQNILKYGSLVVLSLAVIAGMWWAVTSGIKAGQSKQVIADVIAIQEGFEFFYEDQGRYPTPDEFADQNIMKTYLAGFPPEQFNSGPCSETYDYRNTFRDQYELRFCLPAGARGLPAGWNSTTN